MHDRVELGTDGAGDWANFTISHFDLIHRTDRRDFGGRSAKEHLFRKVEQLARNGLLVDRNAQVLRKVHDRATRDSRQYAVGERRSVEPILMHKKNVLARSFAHVAIDIKSNAFTVAVDQSLHANKLRVHVIGSGLRHRRHGIGSKPAPRGHADFNTFFFSGEELSPVVIHDVHVDRRTRGIDANGSVSPHDNWPNVARYYSVGDDQIESSLDQFLERVIELHAIDLGGVEQTLHMIAQAKYSRTLVRLVATESLKHRRAIIDDVRHDVQFGVVPRD